jgi:phage regulator Rha-like protein
MRALEIGMKVISSREIALATEKEHGDIMKDIRNMCNQAEVVIHSRDISLEFDYQDVIVIESEYEVNLHHAKRNAKEYLLNEMASELLATGYDVKRRLAVLRLLKEMKDILDKKFIILQADKIIEESLFKLSEATNKLKNNSSCNIGKRKVYELLRLKGILDEHNKPNKEYIDKGYFKMMPYNKNSMAKYAVTTEEGLKWLNQELFPIESDVTGERFEKLENHIFLALEGIDAIGEVLLYNKGSIKTEEQNRVVTANLRVAMEKIKKCTQGVAVIKK